MFKSILFAAIVCSFVAFAQNGAAKDTGALGRYQLITANIVMHEGKAEETLFKIDTVTGATWRYMRVQLLIPEDKRFPQGTSSNTEGWVPIGEFQKAFDKATKENEKS
jgi:hypothetical protein